MRPAKLKRMTQPMDATQLTVDEAIMGRRSIRRFRSEPIPEGVIDRLIDLARHAPSSMDGQPCCFVVIRDRDVVAALVKIKNAHLPPDKQAYPADFITGAAAVVAVCVDSGRAYKRGRESGILAAAYLLLAAHAHGLGGCYLTAYNAEEGSLAAEISELLNLPEEIVPVALVPLGIPAEAAAPKQMRTLSGLVHHDRYDQTIPVGD